MSQPAWSLWGSWCSQQEIDPFSASIQHVVNFLASLFADGKEYRMLRLFLNKQLYRVHSAIPDFAIGIT